LFQKGERVFQDAESYRVKLVFVFHHPRLSIPCSSADCYAPTDSCTQAKPKVSHAR
jgi:hypothetical protein